MKYFFDIDFIRSYSHSNQNDFIQSDFKEFVRGLKFAPHKRIEVIIFHDEELQKTDIEENYIYELLCDSNVSFRKKEDLNQILEDKESTSFKFFFINTILHGTDISNDYGFFSSNTKDLAVKWENVSSNYRCRKYLSETPSPYNITKWADISFCNLPINCIVISDRYFLKDRTNFEINLFGLLRNLGLKALRKRKVDIFMITEVVREVEKNENTEIKRKKDNEQFVESFMRIQDFLNELIGEEKYNYTLIKVDKKAEVKPHEVHDRLLYTNVLFINPGNSFDFFEFAKSRLKVKAGTIINFDNFIWDGARGPNLELLIQLKLAFDVVSDRAKIGSDGPYYRVLTHNEKSCGLLKQLDNN
jgi:hypothetical protein